MREELLKIIEKNSRIDLKELAVILGVEEIDVVNEMAAMEAEGIICGYHTLIDWEKTSIEKVSALIEVRVTPQRGQGFDSIAELSTLDSILSTATHFILKKYKDHGTILTRKCEDQREMITP